MITRTIPAKKLAETLFTDNWPKRRRWMVVALLWLGGNAQYIIVFGQDNALHQNLAVTLIGAFVSIICFYVFGAVWDDQNKRSALSDIGTEEDMMNLQTEISQKDCSQS